MTEENTETKEKKQNKKELMELLEEKDKQIQEYINDLKRIQAEFENYIKRTDLEFRNHEKFASHKLLLKLLNIADDFDRAVHNLENSDMRDNDVLKGIKLIHKNFHKILQEENIKEIKSAGEKFNPEYHEVLKKVESDKDDDVIIEEIQKGYLLYDKVLRHAKVIVSENIKDKNQNSDSQGGN